VEFRRILALVALAAGVVACTSVEPPSASPSAAATGRGTAALPREIEKLVGPADQNASLQAYVDRVGQRVVAAAGVSGFRFIVLDSPVANAHAVQSYVFVTRGLLALLENEAELAAAIGHELGHLVQRHAAQRARVRQGVLDAAIDATATSGSVDRRPRRGARTACSPCGATRANRNTKPTGWPSTTSSRRAIAAMRWPR